MSGGWLKTRDGGEGDAVESRIFHKSVVRHIHEDQALPDLEGLGKGVVADDIAREAGDATQSVSVLKLTWHISSQDIGPVGHL